MSEPITREQISIYSPMNMKFQDISELRKTVEEGVLNLNLTVPDNRIKLIDATKLLWKNSYFAFTEGEQEELRRSLSTVTLLNENILRFEYSMIDYSARQSLMQLMPQKYAEFKNSIHHFLELIQKDLYNHNLDGFNTVEKQSMIEKLYIAARTKPRFINRFGAIISPEMEIFCRVLRCNAEQKRDNIITVKGPRGIGKTHFTIAANMTMTEMSGNEWDWNRQLVINEDRAYVERLLASLQPKDSIQLDEAGNQINRKLWYQLDQIGFVNYITRLRVHGLTIWLVWPDDKDLDPTLAQKYALFSVEINRTGNAIVKTFNKNTSSKKEILPNQLKNKVTISAEEADKATTQLNPLTLMSIPFFEIPAPLMIKYDERKELSLKASAIKKVKEDQSIANKLYIKFFLSLPSDAAFITAKDTQNFGASEGYKITMVRTSIILGSATGRRGEEILQIRKGDPFDVERFGMIKIDPYIKTYIDKLRAMNKGGNEAKSGE